MNTKTLAIGLLTISALGFVSLPARGDQAVIQDSRQESVNTGVGNTSIQDTTQESNIRTRGRSGYYDDDSTGVVQKSDQYCNQYGEDNLCVQDTDQRSNIRQERRGRTRY